MLWKKWLEFMALQVSSSKLKTVTKPEIVEWVKAGMDYLQEKPEIVKKSFLVCGITNSLDGTENAMIRCARELDGIELPYTDESDDPFCEDLELENADDESDEELSEEDTF